MSVRHEFETPLGIHVALTTPERLEEVVLQRLAAAMDAKYREDLDAHIHRLIHGDPDAAVPRGILTVRGRA